MSETLFSALERFEDAQRALESVFGYPSFRPGQREILDAVLAGHDALGIMPTGGGKSLTYQLPAKMLPGTVLVLSPLISLMKDQVDSLARFGFRATVINSSIEWEERRRRIAALRRGEWEIVYVAPEGLEGSLRDILAGCRVSLVVIDEAHCISHWGHDFRPAYRQLRGLRDQLGDIPVLALTATATRRVADDVVRELSMRSPLVWRGSFLRRNLKITAHKKGEGRNSRRDVLGIVRANAGESGIVYCMSRKGVESLTEWLRAHGVQALPYHAGLADDVRKRHQDQFARDEADVVVATVAFGMGIDKSNVRYVIHRDMPKSIEAWYQEIGRAGRDGLDSRCVLLYSWADVIGYDAFLQGIPDPAVRADTRRRTVELFRMVDRGGCRHQAILAHFDEQIAACGDACDVCRGTSIEDLVARVTVTSAAGSGARVAAAAPVANPQLFEKLRAVRRRLADAEGVPAYIVFSDAVLRQMAEHAPKTPDAMLALSGIGPVKLARYGDAFLAAIREG
ncbi:MAG TPA: ATP-dependent DNA helicase RecQ [Candidatus Eisenbacteria bacterium]|nr:ATP-dependent DNA helicase RecQ [Candidatus Eisenbacteria bacterium]